MNRCFSTNVVKLALCLAGPALGLPALAQAPAVNCDDPANASAPDCTKPPPPSSIPGAPAYPPVPPTLTAAVPPNILLHIDNSTSMNSRPSGVSTGDVKIKIATDVASDLINKNKYLRWGVFTFNPDKTDDGGILQVPVQDVSDDVVRGNITTFISGLTGKTVTPLGEAIFETTRYWAGEYNYYPRITSKTTTTTTTNPAYDDPASCTASNNSGTCDLTADKKDCTITSPGNKNFTCTFNQPVHHPETTTTTTTTTPVTLPDARYTSPIQYRCQKNFNIVISDGEPNNEDKLPTEGSTSYPPIPYAAFDAAGNRIQRQFAICGSSTSSTRTAVTPPTPPYFPLSCAATAANGGSVTAPALRDVSAYAYDRDFKTVADGVDGDGKSWDDPKFPLQNVVTYTVGFGEDIAVLKAAATVGHGKYYLANDKDQLTKALSSAVSEISNIVSNAGGAAASGATFASADKLFQPLYHPVGWYGELLCYKLSPSGAITVACDNPSAIIPADDAARNIYTAKVVGNSTTAFPFKTSYIGTMTVEQQNALGATATDQQNVVNYVRGQTVSSTFRARPNGVLGDIIDGQPLVIAKPAGQTTDSDYSTFKNDNSARGMVFIGANDGMLHGFGIDDMTEFFAFVPSPVYPHLKNLTGVDYGSPQNPHAYFVNGALHQQDLKLGGKWMTLLVGGLAQGGQGYFALDATNQAKMAVKWEFTDKSDADVGFTFGAPIIYNVRTSNSTAVPAVIVANGYKNDYSGDDDAIQGANKPTLFILNANDGSVLKKIVATAGAGGLSSPAGVDFPANGVLDYVYAGDDNGSLWRFDLTPNDIGVPGGAAPAPQLIFQSDSKHPIIMRPVIQVVKDAAGKFIGNLVMFGTGSLLQGSDRLDTTTQTLYGILDKADTTGKLGNVIVGRSDLVKRTVETATVASDTYRKISTDPTLDLKDPANDKLGWYLDLPVPSERIASTPVLLSDRVLFGTGIPKIGDEICTPGKGWLMGLDPLTGSTIQATRGGDFCFIDLNNDGKSTAADKVAFDSGAACASGIQTAGIPTNELSVIVRSVTFTNFSSDDAYAQDAGYFARYESNYSGVFGDTSADGKGSDTKVCLEGSPDCTDIRPVKETAGIKVQTTTWRELIK